MLWPRLSRLARGLNIAIFALPPIAIAPILALTLEGIAPRVVLAALGVYFVTMSATVVGLTQVDTRAADLVRAYGGGRWAVLRLVQARGAVPAILAGFRVAAPNAVLGAILAEFGGGGRWGLGAYLLGSLGRGDPARLWGIGLVATLIAGLSYALFAAISARTLGTTRTVTLTPSAPPDTETRPDPPAVRWALAAGSILLPFVIWWAVLHLPPCRRCSARPRSMSRPMSSPARRRRPCRQGSSPPSPKPCRSPRSASPSAWPLPSRSPSPRA